MTYASVRIVKSKNNVTLAVTRNGRISFRRGCGGSQRRCASVRTLRNGTKNKNNVTHAGKTNVRMSFRRLCGSSQKKYADVKTVCYGTIN